MKHDEKIIEKIKKLINDDWINGGGNRYSHEGWNTMIYNNPQMKLEYMISAVNIMLDEMAEENNLYRKTNNKRLDLIETYIRDLLSKK